MRTLREIDWGRAILLLVAILMVAGYWYSLVTSYTNSQKIAKVERILRSQTRSLDLAYQCIVELDKAMYHPLAPYDSTGGRHGQGE